MERRKFVKSSLLAASAMTAGAHSLPIGPEPADRKSLFELREYEMHFGTSENDLHRYFQNALIPALNKLGIKNVGVFKELSKTEPAKIYLFIPHLSMEAYTQMSVVLAQDKDFQQAASDYLKLPAEKVPYTRFSTKLMIAFEGFPHLAVPPQEPRIFELRTYESSNEEAAGRKIKMFNKEEFSIFYRTQLNPVFFGEVIAGKDMPCLTYMIRFKDMEERDKNWGAFGADPDWKRISSLPEYANTVSRIQRVFLEPLPYSQI